MDAATLTAILALATTLVGAIAYALKKRADAEKMRARRDVLEAEADKQRSVDTGKIIVGAEADAAQLRELFKSIMARLDRCERRHDERDARDERTSKAHEEEIAAKDKLIADLMKQVRGLGDELDEMRASIGMPTVSRGA